jgi:hypothetical protein
MKPPKNKAKNIIVFQKERKPKPAVPKAERIMRLIERKEPKIAQRFDEVEHKLRTATEEVMKSGETGKRAHDKRHKLSILFDDLALTKMTLYNYLAKGEEMFPTTRQMITKTLSNILNQIPRK